MQRVALTMNGAGNFQSCLVVPGYVVLDIAEDLIRPVDEGRGLICLPYLFRHLGEGLIDETKLEAGDQVSWCLVEEYGHELEPFLQLIQRSIGRPFLNKLYGAHLKALHLALEEVGDGTHGPQSNGTDAAAAFGLPRDRKGQLFECFVAEVHACFQMLFDPGYPAGD